MSHFKAVQSREDFKVATGLKVPGTVAQYLRGFQLEGVKFIADHLLNKESCILNDQSGLGKTAVVVAFLSALGTSKKTVILVNDESNVLHWQYHFEKLANISVGAIDDEEEGASSKDTIQIVPWSTLVKNPRIVQKLNFQIVILDNRGNYLSQKSCESFLLKHFERKVQLLIASEDLTSDLDLLYTSLKLVGRLEKKFDKKSAFIDKFSLPETNEQLLLEKDFLENYFMLRNVIRDYCGSYRLRRYTHQFEAYMPLTNKSDFEKQFQNWLGIGNNVILSNTSSQDSVKIISSGSSTSTNELFQTLYLAPKVPDLSQNAQTFVNLDNEDDMPPLMFEDESDSEQPLKPEPKKPKEALPKKVTPEKKTEKKKESEDLKKMKLLKMLEIDFTPKYQANKSILKRVNNTTKPQNLQSQNPKEKPISIKKEPKRLSPVKMLLPIREPKLKEKPVNKQLERLKKLLDIDFTPKHQMNKSELEHVVKIEKDLEKTPKKPHSSNKKEKPKKKNKSEKREKSEKQNIQKSKKIKTPAEIKREKLERLLQIDFTPKYQLNNIKNIYRKNRSKKVPKTKKDLNEKKKAKELNTQTCFQNAQKLVESASPDTTTQDFIPPKLATNSQDSIRLDLDREIENMKNYMKKGNVDSEVIIETQSSDVIVVSDSEDEEDNDFVKSPDIFGGQMEDFITDDESINCSQTAPQTSSVKPTKPKKKSCLQQLESQDLPSERGHNFLDVYSDFLQAQKSNETSPLKASTNNSKPISTGNKITKYFAGASAATQAREILKTPTRRKSFCGIRRSPKTPPNIQNNNIMTWLVRPSSSSDPQDSSVTSSSKDVKRRRLDY